MNVVTGLPPFSSDPWAGAMVTVNVSWSGVLSGSVAARAVAPRSVVDPWMTVRPALVVTVGGSFTGLMVMANVVVPDDARPSLTEKVNTSPVVSLPSLR